MNRTALTCTSIVSLAIIAAATMISARVVAGPLDPPAGAIASTHKTLTEVEPRIAINAANTPGDSDATPSLFKITQPGSYYLTGNITGVAGKHGIEVAVAHVTIDLNGYSLLGVPGSLNGIGVTFAGSSLTVCNGNVSFWGGDAIDGGSGFNQSVENVRAWLNTGGGIRLSANSMIRDCIANNNGGVGIELSDDGVVNACVARANHGGGFSASAGGTFENCTARENTGNGFTSGANSTVKGCTSLANSVNGFSCSITSVVSACSAFANGGDGFLIAGESSIVDCASTDNVGDGIGLSSQCLARGNTCTNNGNNGNAAGIHATGNDNRIEGNLCTSADRGIDVDGTGNIIMRNTCTANTINWTIVGGNTFLIVVANKTVSNFSGDAGGGGYGSTDPNANFTY